MTFDERLQRIGDSADQIIPKIRRGIEKESLRISSDGHLSQRPHPRALGSALTHPFITTDYSEALIELVTPTFYSSNEVLHHLEQLHQVVFQHIDDELLWVNSLPCLLGDENSIPIAEFGTSNIGRMKHVYRRGLGFRYGRKMQIIAGLHYNFSVPDSFWDALGISSNDSNGNTISNAYMAGIRNFHRYCWLLFFLFGASPAACRSFFGDIDSPDLINMGSHTLYSPHATSIRMSNYGYRNPVQSEICIDHNSIDRYIETLKSTISTPYSEYEKFESKPDGEFSQLNANLLQIENEYYSVIRPKRRTLPMEKPTQALQSRGVEYIEVRCLDLDPFETIGISDSQARFLDVFLTYCLLCPSPSLSNEHPQVVATNKDATVLNGRAPNLVLQRNGKKTTLVSWGSELMEDLEAVAEIFDKVSTVNGYRHAVREQSLKLNNPERTPSARILNELMERDEAFFEFAMRKAQESKKTIASKKFAQTDVEYYDDVARASIGKQMEIEREDNLDFEQFLKNYFCQ